ncbi:nitrate reductase subunit alpha [Paenibacillus sp. N3/727]|uniref:nitrate reductase subunit alpha n=1 Tax=Paenibacillus sp. N3/727 TaxID=2925845 RepID=UPI001F532A08|nr:nitrate reductase subunit alpha [Paenibacillus sp. N3/727]UNK16250.1 nitrate reductase subunit alpha [Paenibacillus sp. N3/727]
MKKSNPLLQKLKFFHKRETNSGGWSEVSPADRSWEDMYRNRWQHDKVVRSTHGVNCTGSCSWKIFVKDGIVTWETQQTDYPTTGPDMPEFEPRGCPRGASFSWYLYSPLRVKYPYIRGKLLQLWREARKEMDDPVRAWASIVEDEQKKLTYKSARGKGGMVRSTWEEVSEIISASTLYTIQQYGPDRVFGFSPIPAMSMISYAAGSRFLSLIGSPLLSFYDWYADLPPASPQIWGDQTDVPESSDWYNSSYLLVWGSNLPMTRTPDAHFMTEARYRGTKVVSVSPDYAEFVRFADDWLPAKQGTDGALAMAMGHVILTEFYMKQRTPYFDNYVKKYTDFPFLVILSKEDGKGKADRFLNAHDLGVETNNAEWKTVMIGENTGKLHIPNGTIGSRWGEEGRWNLELIDTVTGEEISPQLGIGTDADGRLELMLPYFDDEGKKTVSRTVPYRTVTAADGTEYCVTTVFDLTLAQYGVDPSGEIRYDDADTACTPAWQETITGVDQGLVTKIAREFAQNAIDSQGRSMIVVGAGINHWYNSDTIYRSILNLVLMTGCQGVNGGGWAHYVGQEKLRPAEGWANIAFARDWTMPPRQQNGTSFFYFATDQWRYESNPVDGHTSSLVDKARYEHNADYNVLAARLGWLPSYPQFNENSLTLTAQAKEQGMNTNEEISQYVAQRLKDRSLQFAIEDPDAAVNHPKVMFVWRANLISSSGKGHEYFLKHLLGTHNGLLNDDQNAIRPKEIIWRDKASEGKLDLMVDIDFRMSGTAVYSDIVLPAATWYEKSDLSSTDMHPFIHPFNPAVPPLWESKSDWETFKTIAKSFSEMAKGQFDAPVVDVVSMPLQHDTPDELAQPHGKILDWSKQEIDAIPGKTMPKFVVVERDYTQVYEKMISLGPNVKEKPYGIKGMNWSAAEEYELLKKVNGVTKGMGVGAGCPQLITDRQIAEAILTLSSTSNGKMAVKAWEALEQKTALKLKDLAEDRMDERFTFDDITAKPKTVITSPAFSGSEQHGRRYSPFTTNIERMIPFRTLTGRQHFYLDHELLTEFGENMAIFKPTLKHAPFHSVKQRPGVKGKEIVLNFMTPHSKWSIHSMYYDSLPMLTLFRGGPTIWMNKDDAASAEIKDNDWIECFNQNGAVVARAVLTHRIPRGMVFMHHAQDRTINVPATDVTATRGGTHNSPTRIHVKPTHMIGGYAQLSYGFNYYGPTGNQRDLYVVIRKLQEVNWLED